MQRKTSLLGGAALSLVLATGLGAAARADDAASQEYAVTWKGAPEQDQGDQMFKVRGRLLMDAVFENFKAPNSGVTGSLQSTDYRARQVFIGVEGRLNSQWAYKVEGGAQNNGSWGWDDAVLEFKPTANSSILFGNAKADSIENITSTRFLTFMERGPFAQVAGLDFKLGAVARTWGSNWSATGALQTDNLNTVDQANGKDLLAEVGRITFVPINTPTTKVHLAVWGRHRDFGQTSTVVGGAVVNTDNTLSYSFRPNVALVPSLSPFTFRNTGAISTGDNTVGLEAMAIVHSFSVQGEWAHLSYKGAGANPDDSIDTGYVFASVWATGEQRGYAVPTGEVNRPKIKNPLGGGGMGGLEFAVRYDFVNMPGTPSAGNAGDYKGVTLGANWYPNSYVRFMANYTDGKQNNPVGFGDVKARIFQLRAQIDW